jgi:menaquinone-9 beta-reductase
LAESTDIFVIGGGPAGLAMAISARQQGFRVIVADGAEPPIDKACGEGLLPDGVEALETLGVPIPLSDGLPFRGIRFLVSDLSAEAEFSGRACGLAVRRTTLHRILMEQAAANGAELWWRTTVSGIEGDTVRLSSGTVRARWIIGADGSTSRVRRWAGLDRGAKPRLRYAFRRHYRVAPWTDYMEVYWGRECQGYATAVNREQVCVALASENPGLRLEDGLQSLPALRARLEGAETISTERGCLTGNRSYLRRYEREHRRLALRPSMMARLMLTLDRKPRLQRRTLQVLRKHPQIFERLLELHVGARSPLDLALDGLTLGWGLLTTSA